MGLFIQNASDIENLTNQSAHAVASLFQGYNLSALNNSDAHNATKDFVEDASREYDLDTS